MAPVNGTVSVCIPAYRGRFLAATIESVLSQTRPAEEIIVVDDASPDGLEEIVLPYAGRGVRYVRNPENLGVPANYERALGLGRADYVMIFGDHDIMRENFIECCAGLLDRDPQVVLAFSEINFIDEHGIIIKRHNRNLFPPIFPGRQLVKCLVTQMAAPVNTDTLIRRSALAGLEPWFDPRYFWYGDIYLWIRLAAKGKVGYVSQAVLHRRLRETGHPLDNHEWQSMLACDRLRRDSWPLAFGNNGLGAWWYRLLYTARRDYAGLLLILSKLARAGDDRARVLPPEALAVFSPAGRNIARLTASLPPKFVRILKVWGKALKNGTLKK